MIRNIRATAVVCTDNIVSEERPPCAPPPSLRVRYPFSSHSQPIPLSSCSRKSQSRDAAMVTSIPAANKPQKTSALASPHQQSKKRERKKTFTGCWTCRSRKLKCDETYPACRQCSSKSLQCAGYGARLHWLPCSNGREKDERKLKIRMEGCQRRMVVRGEFDAELSDENSYPDLKSWPLDELNC